MRVSYWTGWLDPQMVAVSKEVHQLMRHFPRSWAFGLSTHYSLYASWRRRSLGLHPRFYGFARPLLGVIERQFDISHVYTSLGDWHFLTALGRRPLVLTATQQGTPASPQLLRKVDRVVVETERLAADALSYGVDPQRLSVIHPGVDLDVFRVAPVPAPPWKCVFASSPENEDEIHTKGVDLLLDAAAARPQIEFTLLWRPFGPAADRALERVRQRAPVNVILRKERIADMAEFLSRFHFAVAPFRSVGKPCPNSILEMLALGRPALVSDFVHIGDLLEREGAGLAFACTPESLVAAVDRLCAGYDAIQRGARACAQRHFDLKSVTAAYRRVYEDAATSRGHTSVQNAADRPIQHRTRARQ
jgi:glycosyltransferase involved in cell wall biosynthesis